WERCTFPFRFPLRWKTPPCLPSKLFLPPLERSAGSHKPIWRKEALMALKTYGPMAVDWENRIDFDRLRRERLARAKALLEKSEMGALLCFDMNNVRYLTATHIGTWAQ